MAKLDEARTVYIIDDDHEIGLALAAILSRSGYQVSRYTSSLQFLSSYDDRQASTTLADVRMPGMDGLQLQEEIVRRSIPTSTIIMTGHADVSLAVKAMKAGAFDFLEKPFDNAKLLDLLPGAFTAAMRKLETLLQSEDAKERFQRLSGREKEIALLLSKGLSNKAIAERLMLSARTVEHHRAHLMEKLEVTTVAELFRLVLGLKSSTEPHGT